MVTINLREILNTKMCTVEFHLKPTSLGNYKGNILKKNVLK